MLKEFTRVEVKNTEKLQSLSIETFKLSRMCQVPECSQKKERKLENCASVKIIY